MGNQRRPGYQYKIFMGLTEVAGYYNNLKKGFDVLGIDSLFVDGSRHRFGYEGERPRNLLVSLLRYTGSKRNSHDARLKWLWQLAYHATRLPLLAWALLRYNVFIFGFKSSLLPGFWDLPILKLWGKRVIYVFHGSDSRPPFINRVFLGADLERLIRDCLELTRKQKEQIRPIERYADYIVNHPPTSHFHRRKVIKWLSIGIPYAMPSVRPKPRPACDQERWQQSTTVRRRQCSIRGRTPKAREHRQSGKPSNG
jgi:hypothetical protein